LGSWALNTFSAPIPNSGFRVSAAFTGSGNSAGISIWSGSYNAFISEYLNLG